MFFRKKEIPGAVFGTTVTYYEPAGEYPPASVPQEGYTSITVEGKGVVRALSEVLRMALVFREDRAERARLGHDCGIFALACVTGVPMKGRLPLLPEDVEFPEVRSEPLRTADLSTFGREAGSLVASYDVRLSGLPVQATTESFHVQVRGTHAADPPLYFSKFGAEGDVVLHELAEAMKAYPATIVYDAGAPVVRGVPLG